MKLLFAIAYCVFVSLEVFAAPPPNRVASLLVSEDFINSQLKAHAKSQLLTNLKISLNADNGQLFFHGIIKVPIEELKAINLDPSLGAFRFQATVKPKVTSHGHLILEFPLSETYFYPETSKDPIHDRVIVPVQLLSVALASVRGYLAALSGDFSSFDRRTKKLTAEIKSLDHAIATEKNPDARDDMRTQRDSLKLQMAAIPIERKQLQIAAKEVEHILSFSGEKEVALNEELGARKNALFLKFKLSEITPYLNGVELGGVRVIHDKKDGTGQNYLAIDITSDLAAPPQPDETKSQNPRAQMKIPPALIIRLNQSVFESDALVAAEKKETKIKDLDFQLKDDGLHVSGKMKALLFSVPFDAIVDFSTIKTDIFEVRVQDIKVAGIDFEFLSKFILESVKKRLDAALKNTCTFESLNNGGVHSLRVTVNPKALIPALPNLHLTAVDVREREFLLKIGEI